MRNLISTSASVLLLLSVMQAADAQVPANSPNASAGVFIPPSSDSPASAGPLDPMKMPQINGIHIGTSIADAKAALQKLYPGRQVDAINGQAMGAQHQSWPQALRALGDSIGTDETDVDVTYPPGPQVVWHVDRIAHQPNVAHDVLVAALRAKYGKETAALHNGSGTPVTVDRQINVMYWVYDEQGRQITQTKVLHHSPFNCVAYAPTNGDDANLYFGLVRDANAVPAGYCRDAYVAVTASLPETDIVTTMYLDMVDLPLAARSARTTDAWSKGLDQKTQQSTREQAKSAQPQL
jgi:hypothetical protein